MRRVWKMETVDERQANRLAKTLSVAPIIARLLLHRGVSEEEAADFLCADFSLLADPRRMEGLEKGAALIRRSISRREPILLVGDYDVDGLTGTALLTLVLAAMGGQVTTHIPHRLTEGYGLKPAVVKRAAQRGARLLVAIDCGTNSVEEIRLARRLRMETIVVDHHDPLPGPQPPASALLNPLQPGCRYPNKDLASVGVAFTLARGLLGTDACQHLDLVALGTVADHAPLTGENRILVKAGLHRLAGTEKAGLRALLSQTQLSGRKLSPEEIAFTLAPRLNAAGRLGSADGALRLLLTRSPKEAGQLARKINLQNRTRATVQRLAIRRALAKVEREVDFSRQRVIVLADEEWHAGVSGIIASRLAAHYHRPAVVIALNGRLARGSARSIAGFDLVAALEEVKEHLVEFGGHPAAAGLTIEPPAVGRFRDALNQVAHQRLTPGSLTPCLQLDGELPLKELTDELLRDMEVMAPFGPGNPWPMFVSDLVRLNSAQGTGHFGGRRIRLVVEDSQGRSFQALHPRMEFGEGWNFRKITGKVKLAYSPVRRLHSQGASVELSIHDLEPVRD